MNFIRNNIYFFLFIALTIEWPITGFVGGEYASQGKLNLFLLFILAVFWDIIWDICIYFCWRFFYKWKYINKFKFIKKIKKYVTEKEFLENLLVKYPFFFFLIVKITPYLSTPSLFSVWMKKYHFWKFLFFSILISCIVKTVYISLGYLWWISLAKLQLIQEWRRELVLFIIIGVALFYLIKYLLKKFSKRLINWSKKKLQNFRHKE